MRTALRAAAEPHGLSDSEALLLLLCADDATGNLSQRELAAITAMSTAAVSGHLESLRQRELVSSTRDPDDRRRQTWTASEQGQSVVKQITQSLADTDDNSDNKLREAA